MILSNVLKSGIYAIIVAVVLLLIAIDIIVVARGVLGIAITASTNLGVLGAMLLVYSFIFKGRAEKIYYGFWGLFLSVFRIVIGI